MEVALRYGLLEAVLLEVLANLQKENQAELTLEQGYAWLPLTISQLQAQMPYASPYCLKGALALLESNQLILMRSQSIPGFKRRRLQSYALAERGTALLLAQNK